MKNIVLLLGVLFLFAMPCISQNHQTTDNYGVWLAYTGTHKFAEKWGLHIEGQVRQANFMKDQNQLFFRTGLIYYLNAQLSLTAGYAFAQSYAYGEFPAKSSFPEHRVWEQMQIKNQLNATEWISRFRLEQRFSYLPIPDSISGYKAADTSTYTNRFRLSNKFSIPFKGKTIEDKSIYFYVADEFFINFGKNVKMNIFDQNRFQLGFGYKIPQVGRLEVGYLLQSFQKSDGIKIQHDHNIVVALNCNISFMKKKK